MRVSGSIRVRVKQSAMPTCSRICRVTGGQRLGHRAAEPTDDRMLLGGHERARSPWLCRADQFAVERLDGVDPRVW